MAIQQEQKASANQSTNSREAGMMVITGAQGVGKTYQNMHTIAEYVRDKPKIKVRGRKCLIFDTNGEFTPEQFSRNNIKDFKITRIGLRDVEQWSRTDNSECRRIDAKNLSIKEKKEAVEFLLKIYRNGMLVLEDINTYILSVTFMEEIVGGLVNLRHRAVDVMISYQSLRPVEPRIWQNSRWVRFHYQADNVMDIKAKVTNPTLFKIAQLLVNEKYFSGDKRFFVYIHNFQNKIQGNFKKADFETACKKYLSANKKYAKEYQQMNNCTMEEAIDGQVTEFFNEYWGNS
ncbi:MAG TPA: type IV secretion system DNA-binding domain-containing protein [Chitinophagales bacterium]|nr:type IV secretion system DNA-binding domain-containing protein [Chitinophagales bacterium]